MIGRPKERAHELSDVEPRRVVYVVLGLFGVLGLSGLLIVGLFRIFDRTLRQPAVTALEAQPITPPAPRLETSPAGDRAAIEARSLQRLQGYAWTDRAAGRVRIPIDEAIRLIVMQGWPDKTGGSP